MKIYAKTKNKNPEYYNRIPLPSQVKVLGKYLEKNLAGVDKSKTSQPPNEYIIYDTILYQVKKSLRKDMKQYPELKDVADKVYEAKLYFNVTTYAQNIRINVIRADAKEETLGHLRLEPNELNSLPYCKRKLLDYVKKVIGKAYKGYEVLLLNEDY